MGLRPAYLHSKSRTARAWALLHKETPSQKPKTKTTTKLLFGVNKISSAGEGAAAHPDRLPSIPRTCLSLENVRTLFYVPMYTGTHRSFLGKKGRSPALHHPSILRALLSIRPATMTAEHYVQITIIFLIMAPKAKVTTQRGGVWEHVRKQNAFRFWDQAQYTQVGATMPVV